MLQILEDDLEKGEIAKGPYYWDKLGQQNQLVEQLEKLDGDDRVRVLQSISETFETSGMSSTVEPLLNRLSDPAEKITSEDKELLLTHIDTWCANNNCTGNINGFLKAVERNYVHPEQESGHFASRVSNLVQQLKDLRIDGDRDHNDRYQEMRSSIIKTLDPQNEKNIGSLLDDLSNPEVAASPENYTALVRHISEYNNPSVSSNPTDAFLNDVKDRWSFDTGSPPRFNLYPLKIKKDYPIEIERTLDFSRASGYHDLLGGVLNYRLVHQTMADDIRRELSGKSIPDVVIAITGNPHVSGLKQQLPEFANSKTIVVTGNEVYREKPLTDPTAKAVHDENNKLIEGGEIVGFDFDKNTNGAIIPERLTEVINQESQSKRSPESFAHVDISATIDALDLATNKLPSKTKREKSGASITSSPIEILRDKYLPLIAQACLEKFSTGRDSQNFKNFLTGVTEVTSQEIDEAITSKDLTKFTKIFESISLSNLIAINGGEGLDLIKQDDLSDLKKNTKTFFKVTFDENLTPTLTALDTDKIWSEEGLDRTQPFIVINPGNGPTNLTNLAVSSEQEVQKYVISEAKVFERGVRKGDLPEAGRQYLVTVNEEVGQPNMDLIRSHNANPEGFTTPYTKEQARLIYGPLITENGITPDGHGTPLLDQEIVQNLSKARSYNASLGSVIANCQTNALVAIMRDLGIAEKTIIDGVESMRRLDGPNMAATSPGISQSTVIFEGANDKLAEDFIGGRKPALPTDHDHTSVVPIDDHRVKVYQTLPTEVYHPGKKPTDEQKQEEDKIVRGLPRIKTLEEIRALGRGDEIRQAAAKSKAQDSFESRKENVLKYMGLDGFRFKDPNTHNAPHLTMPATPGNEVDGRDQDLLYKLMADMMTRENPRDVSHYFDQQKEISTQTASNDSNQTTDQKWSEKYPSKKSAEAEDLIEQKNSWKEILETTGKSKDDSTITR